MAIWRVCGLVSATSLLHNLLNERTCCLLPRFVNSVKFMTSGSLAPSAPGSPSSSASSLRFLRNTGGGSVVSHRAKAVFLSTLRESPDVSVTSLASSLANSASSSSDGPRFSWIEVDLRSTASGEGARSSICKVMNTRMVMETIIDIPVIQVASALHRRPRYLPAPYLHHRHLRRSLHRCHLRHHRRGYVLAKPSAIGQIFTLHTSGTHSQHSAGQQ